MEKIGMIQFNASAADAVCFSLAGALSVVPVKFSLPAPKLNFSSWFSVSARIQTEWQVFQERSGHFFISVAGLIRSTLKKVSCLNFRLRKREINVLRSRILKLSTGGRRL